MQVGDEDFNVPPTTGEPVAQAMTVAQKRRRAFAATVDGGAWLFGVVLAVAMRFEFMMDAQGWVATMLLGLVAGGLHIGAGYYLALYRCRFTYCSFEEVRVLGILVLAETIFLALFIIPFGNLVGVPRGTSFLAAPIVLLLMFGVRYLARLAIERSRKPGADAEPALVVGAGYIADRLLHHVNTDPTATFRPVALLDDDPAKANLLLRGVPVIGRTDDIQDAAARTGATMLIVAIGHADSTLLRKLSDLGERAGLRVVVTPTLADLQAGAE